MKQKLSILMLFVVAPAACSDDGGGGSVTPDTFASRAATASCDYEFRCCSDAERMTDFSIFHTSDGMPVTTQAQCDDVYSAFFEDLIGAQWQASIDAGRVTFDGSAAAACLSLVEHLACGTTDASIDYKGNCQPYLVPLVDNDGACSQSYECKSGDCEGATSGNGSGSAGMDGACKVLPAMGAPCTGKCADGLFCDFQNNDTCQPTLADGMACEGDDDCTSGNCNDSGACGADAPRCTGN